MQAHSNRKMSSPGFAEAGSSILNPQFLNVLRGLPQWRRSCSTFNLQPSTINHQLSTINILSLLLALSLTFFVTGCSRQAKAARHASRADKYYAAGDFSKAEIEYLISRQLAPPTPNTVSRLATLYYEQGRFSRAFMFLKQAAEMSPTNMDLQVKLGTIYLAAHKMKEARSAATLVLEKRPADAEAPVLLAESISSPKDASEISAVLSKLEGQLGKTAPLRIAQGVIKVRSGALKEAEQCFKEAIELAPNSSAAWFGLGNLYSAEGNKQEAEPALKKASELSPPRSPRRLSYAEFKIRTGQLEEGKQLLAAISKDAPDYVPAWVRQAEIALAEKQYTNCSSLLREASARDSANFDAMLLQGRLFLAERKFAKALEEFDRLTQVYESSGQAHYFLALAHLASEDPVKAIKSLNRSVALEPNNPEAVLLLAELNIRKGDASAAISSLKQFTAQRPQLPQGHLLLANAYLAARDLEQAAAVYEHMLQSFPNSPQVPLFLGLVLVQQKKVPEARTAFEQALTRTPGYLPAIEQLVELDLTQKRFNEALARINEQITKQPNAPELLVLLAREHMAKAGALVQNEMKTAAKPGQKLAIADLPAAVAEANEAEAALLKALELNPNYRPAYLMLAQVYVASNKYQAALARLTSLTAKTNEMAALMQIGMIHDELKEYAAAREAYTNLLSRNPTFTPALNNLAYLYSERLGQLDQAYELADKARQLLPSDPYTADTLGWILYRRHEYTRALGLLAESARMLPNEAEIQFHLGMTHYMLGEEALAKAALQAAADSDKQFPGKENIAGCLEILALDAAKATPEVVATLQKKTNPGAEDPVVLNRLALIYETNGDFTNAVLAYERITKIVPQNAQAISRAASLYAGPLNDHGKAIELARQAHSLAPDDGQVCAVLARLVYQIHDYKWAFSLSQEAARKLPDDPQVLYDLAWASYTIGHIEDAVATMDKVLQLGPPPGKASEAKLFAEFASVPLTTSSPSRERVTAVLKEHPRYLPALMASAIIDERAGRNAEAKAAYQKISEDNPLFTPAVRRLALLWPKSVKDASEGYSIAAKAREAYPQDAAIAKTLGIFAYLRRNDDPRASELLNESVRKGQDDPEALYYLGMSHHGQKQSKQSKDALQRALALKLPEALAADAQKVLVELK
ncbi:MAG TPA: tetratricopeptide repeat protein [Candidatus Dormibacteraeota bacterium]|nr:tetratricopeptide repeat protein [Candidatus Dormibacteraeota bacterium]